MVVGTDQNSLAGPLEAALLLPVLNDNVVSLLVLCVGRTSAGLRLAGDGLL